MQSSALRDADNSKAHPVRKAALSEKDSSISAEIEGQQLRASFSVHTQGDQQASLCFPPYLAAGCQQPYTNTLG